MFTLHYAPDNASMIVRLVLDEAGLPYRTALVNRAGRAQDSAAYRAINPTGLIPALETPHGPMFETAAILLWLADQSGMAPPADSPDRGPFLTWLFFLSNTPHADLRRMFYPELYVPADAVAAHHQIIADRMQRHFALLDLAAHNHPTLFAPPSILTIYTCALMRWSVLYPTGAARWFRLSDYPTLAALAAAQETRPATKAAILAEGLGPTPFTAPTYATPPEGSAI